MALAVTVPGCLRREGSAELPLRSLCLTLPLLPPAVLAWFVPLTVASAQRAQNSTFFSQDCSCTHSCHISLPTVIFKTTDLIAKSDFPMLCFHNTIKEKVFCFLSIFK